MDRSKIPGRVVTVSVGTDRSRRCLSVVYRIKRKVHFKAAVHIIIIIIIIITTIIVVSFLTIQHLDCPPLAQTAIS